MLQNADDTRKNNIIYEVVYIDAGFNFTKNTLLSKIVRITSDKYSINRIVIYEYITQSDVLFCFL